MALIRENAIFWARLLGVTDLSRPSLIGSYGPELSDVLGFSIPDDMAYDSSCVAVVNYGVVDSVDRHPGLLRPYGFRFAQEDGYLAYMNLDLHGDGDFDRATGSWFDQWLRPGRRLFVLATQSGQGAILTATLMVDADYALSRAQS